MLRGGLGRGWKGCDSGPNLLHTKLVSSFLRFFSRPNASLFLFVVLLPLCEELLLHESLLLSLLFSFLGFLPSSPGSLLRFFLDTVEISLEVKVSIVRGARIAGEVWTEFIRYSGL